MKPRANPKLATPPQRRLPAHELFPQPGVYRPQNFTQTRRPKRKDPPWVWGLVFLLFLVMGFGLLGWLRRPHLQAPYVLVEVRALEESGHPVAAARLTINDRPMGVTDSFGEWRRYMRVQSGDLLAVDLTKAGANPLTGRKAMRVPPVRNIEGSSEMRMTIEMRGQRTLAQNRRPARERADMTPDIYSDGDEVKVQPSPDFSRRKAKAVRQEVEEVEQNLGEGNEEPSESETSGDTNDASLGIYFDDGLSTISVRFKPNSLSPSNLLEKHQGEILQQKIIPLLANDLNGLGLKVEKAAAWQLTLQYVPKEDQVGYIRGQINWPNPFGQMESTTFIAGFAKTFDETVRALSSLLRIHMKKSYWAFKDNGRWFIDEPSDTKAFWRLRTGLDLSDTNGIKFPLRLVSERAGSKRWQLDLRNQQPCHNVRQRLRCLVSTQSLKDSPPLAGWQKQQLRIQGSLPKGTELYVAGFQANSLGNGSWEYWGHPGSNHKALLLSQGRIIHSEIFVDQTNTQTQLRLGPVAQLRQARRK